MAVDLENPPTDDTDVSATSGFESSRTKISASRPRVEHGQGLVPPPSPADTAMTQGVEGTDAVPAPPDAEPAAVDDLPSDSSDQDVTGQQDLAVSADLLCSAASKTKQQQPLLFAARQSSPMLMDNLNSVSTRPTAEGTVSLAFSSGQILMNKGISGGLCAFETRSSLYSFAPRFDETGFELISTELDFNRKQATPGQARRIGNNGNG